MTDCDRGGGREGGRERDKDTETETETETETDKRQETRDKRQETRDKRQERDQRERQREIFKLGRRAGDGIILKKEVREAAALGDASTSIPSFLKQNIKRGFSS
jgi:hypothetical protein